MERVVISGGGGLLGGGEGVPGDPFGEIWGTNRSRGPKRGVTTPPRFLEEKLLLSHVRDQYGMNVACAQVLYHLFVLFLRATFRILEHTWFHWDYATVLLHAYTNLSEKIVRRCCLKKCLLSTQIHERVQCIHNSIVYHPKPQLKV